MISNKKFQYAIIFMMLVIWLPRAFALTTFVTADERAWLTRSGNFYRALAHGDFAQTYQKEHPGVTIMWLGTAGFLWRYPAYALDVPGELGWVEQEIEPFLRAHGYSPLDLLGAGRFFVVLTITIVLTAAFLATKKLIGFFPALLAFLLIAFNPFHVGLSRLLHLDALLSSLMLLSLLAFLNYLKTSHRRDLILSAVAGGLACLTKSPALFLAPFFALLVLLKVWQASREKKPKAWQKELQQGIKTLFLWGTGVVIIFVLLWPAMWVNPVGTIEQVVGEALFHAAEGHRKPHYFLSQVIVDGDPGPYFYPMTYLWRTTPIVLIGLLLTLWSILQSKHKSNAKVAFALLLFAISYTLFMTTGAKKFDRYVLPIYMPLNIIAGMGWVATAHSLKGRLTRPLLLGMIILLQSLLTLKSFPYYYHYYNPLLGGLPRAQKTMTIGWGEGLNLAAQYLNNKPNAEELQVMSGYWDGPFSYFFNGQTVQLDNFYAKIDRWLNSDYLVVYVNQWQRQTPSPETIAYLNKQTPEKVIDIDGVEYARIYNMQTIEPFDPLLTARPVEVYACPDEEIAFLPTYGGAIRLQSYDLPQQPVIPGTGFTATFNLQSVAPIDRNLNFLLRVVGADGEVMRQEGWPWGSPTSTWQACATWPDGHTLTMPADSPAGYYRIELGFYDSTLLLPLPAHDTQTAQAMGENVLIDYVVVGDPAGQWGDEVMTDTGAQSILGTLEEKINLLAVQLDSPEGEPITGTEQAIRVGETQKLRLLWQTRAPLSTDYTIFVHLYGPDGQLILQRDQQPQNGFIPTSYWKPQWLIPDEYQIPIPPDAPAGAYTLQIGMYDLQTGQRLPVTRDGEASGDVIEVGPFVVE